jgi:two-component system response regulator NreC
MTNPKIRVLVADDHAILRQGLKRILEEEPDLEVVGEAATGKAAVDLTRELEPDVVVLDVSMPDQSGIESMGQIAAFSQSRVLILSVHREKAVIGAAISAGAAGYLPKDSLDTELLGAIRAIHKGGSVFSPDVTRILAQDPDEQPTPKLDVLTTREKEIFHLLAEGKSARQVAELLHISPKTVHTHRQHILDKLGFENLAQLIRFAIVHELG